MNYRQARARAAREEDTRRMAVLMELDRTRHAIDEYMTEQRVISYHVLEYSIALSGTISPRAKLRLKLKDGRVYCQEFPMLPRPISFRIIKHIRQILPSKEI